MDRNRFLGITFVCVTLCICTAGADVLVEHPFVGVTHYTRTETSPSLNMHIVQIDLAAPGIGFKLTPQSGSLDTTRQRTVDFLNQEQAQVAVNVHFMVPFGTQPEQQLVGLAASNGHVYSPFEPQPVASGYANQSYAIVPFAPGLNIDANNQAGIVHRDPSDPQNLSVLEPVSLFNAVSGSAQVITNGVESIPLYLDAEHPDGLLTALNGYSNSNSWYNLQRARTVIGLNEDNSVLTLFTVDQAGGSVGMGLGSIVEILMNEYGVYNALNLDGGGSTSLAMADPITGVGQLVNHSADSDPLGRAVGSNLAIFAQIPEPGSLLLLVCAGVVIMTGRRS